MLVGLVILVCFSCCQSRQSQLKELSGTWILDSVSTPTGKIITDKDKFKKMIFSGNGRFTYSWANGDVGGEYKGEYFINKNTYRQCKTITLIADEIISGTDTIRHYLNLDILALDNRRLKTSGQTEFLERPDKSVVYTPISIFRRD